MLPPGTVPKDDDDQSVRQSSVIYNMAMAGRHPVLPVSDTTIGSQWLHKEIQVVYTGVCYTLLFKSYMLPPGSPPER